MAEGDPGRDGSVEEQLAATLARLRVAQRQRMPRLDQRLDDLKRLRAAVLAHTEALVEAADRDFGHRSRHETLFADLVMTVHEIDHLRGIVRRLMRPQRVWVDWKFWPAVAEIRCQPLGVIGILSPWNYPINLALMTLAAAIGAGNHVMLKPSEHTPRTSAVLAEMLGEVFPADRVQVVTGDARVAQAFSALPFDHLVFTGSTAVGRSVMAAAAPNLTPLTLELGGKSPVVIGPDFDLDAAAARILPMKFLNAGQTCIAPDYVLVPRDKERPFAEACRKRLTAAYPDLAHTADYTRIIDDRQFARLAGYVEEATKAGVKVEQIEPGGPAYDPAQRLFPPTLMLEPDPSLKVMQQEIFGPILPILGYDTLHEAVEFVRDRPRPLAFYLFERDRRRIDFVLERIVAGGVCVNDAAMQFTQPSLPFGGVGPSGMGHYHGEWGLKAFSKQMPVFRQARFSAIWLFKPPYGRMANLLLRFLYR